MKELLDNIAEFIESGEENLKKNRFNAAASDFFKAIVISCDYLIYKEIRILPKNHNDRFSLLKKYFPDIYLKVSNLFKKYVDSYNLRLEQKDAISIKTYSYEIRTIIKNKK
ncbi:MAG: hypothetical protein WC916_04480 [Candidatus Woesearchaeota archaeon]